MGVNRFTKVCVKCQVELRPKQNGILLVEAAIFGFISLRDADLWHCPECGLEVVVGAGEQHYGHWEGDLVAEIERRENRGQRVVLCWMNRKEREEFMRRGKEAAEASLLAEWMREAKEKEKAVGL